MTKFINKLKKTVFGPFLVHFPNLEGKNIFFQKTASVMHNLI